MDYKAHYNLLINKAQNRLMEGYVEKHYIIPKCMGGSNYKNNVVRLTPEEHFVAHQLLVKMYPDNLKLLHAANMMTVTSKSNQKRNNKMYGWLKKRRADKMKVWALENNVRPPDRTGTTHSEETKKRMSDAAKGKPKSEAHRKAMSEANMGRTGYFKGKTHSLKSRQQISLNRSLYGMTFEKADQIRHDAIKGIPRKDIVKKYKITHSIVSDVVRNISWVQPKPIAQASKPAVDF